MCLPVVVRTSISNHHLSGKRKKPKPRHNAPCSRQLVRYKLYEIRLDTLKKRRYAPAEPRRADNNCRHFRLPWSSPPSIISKAKGYELPYPIDTQSILADFPKISSSFQNITLLYFLKALPSSITHGTFWLLEYYPKRKNRRLLTATFLFSG